MTQQVKNYLPIVYLPMSKKKRLLLTSPKLFIYWRNLIKLNQLWFKVEFWSEFKENEFFCILFNEMISELIWFYELSYVIDWPFN